MGLILSRPFRASTQNIELNCCVCRPPRPLAWAILFQAFGLMGSSVDGGPSVQAEGLGEQSLGRRPRWQRMAKGASAL